MTDKTRSEAQERGFFRHIRGGERIWRGWGICYRRYEFGDAICCPIPLNILIHYSYRLYWAIVWWNLRWRGNKQEYLIKAFKNGYDLGYKDAQEATDKKERK